MMASSKPKAQPENTCQYCLYLKPPPGSRHATGGNCSLHREWIERAARTTCSDMSNLYLPKGIYHPHEPSRGEWRYVRRKKRIRTRLFLISTGSRGKI